VHCFSLVKLKSERSHLRTKSTYVDLDQMEIKGNSLKLDDKFNLHLNLTHLL
jgi:hypothetical protein